MANAGLDIATDPADIDEGAVRRTLEAEGAGAEEIALALARGKAAAVAPRHPQAAIIAADQILVCDGRLFEKPRDRAAALDQLRALQGRSHQLVSAVVLCQGGAELWSGVDTATLTLRPLDDADLADYLDVAGDAALASVGAYQIEGPGIRLFERVDGDVFTIQGLPLLMLLAALRENEIAD